jgi:hypothetical protein
MALIVGSGLLVSGFLAATLSSLVAAEIKAWSPSIIRGLIKFAVERLPENLRERFTEEWQSHVNEVPGQVGKLLVALGFSIAAYDVVLDSQRNQVLEDQLQVLRELDGIQSGSNTTVHLVQNLAILASRPDLGSLANGLSLSLSECQETRDKLAAEVALASAKPSTLFVNLSFALARKRLQNHRDQILKRAEQIREGNSQIAKLVEEKTRRLGQ